MLVRVLETEEDSGVAFSCLSAVVAISTLGHLGVVVGTEEQQQEDELLYAKPPLSLELATRVLEAEEALRKSPRIQQMMADYEADDLKDWIRVVKEVVEPEICAQFNISLQDKRTILAWYPELTDKIFYGKYNRARRGALKEGDAFVPVPLTDVNGEPIVSMFPVDDTRPVVLIAGSIT